MKGWKRIVEKAKNGERPLHRDRKYKKDERKEEKEKKKRNWYKGKDGKSFESVLMIPATPHGELKQIVEKKAKEAKLKVKIVEKAGMKLGTYLKKFDTTNKKEPCKEKDCLVCMNTTKMTRKCRIQYLRTRTYGQTKNFELE